MDVLLDQVLTLEKFPGKGGWTFVRLPEIKTSSGRSLGWDKLRFLFDASMIIIALLGSKH